MKPRRQLANLRILLFFLFLGNLANSQINLENTNDSWRLLVDGQPFDIKGATFGYVDDVASYDRHFQELQYLGVNTIRLWGTDKNTWKLLNSAHKYNIKVMVGIWMRHGRPGMEDDDRFDYLKDEEGKEAMFQNAVDVVEKYKSHPAVLCWGVGNEVYLNTATNAEKIAYSKLLERICAKIQGMDSRHPIISVEAWTFGLDWWEKYVPSIDIYGLNCYGPGAAVLSEELHKKNIKKPFIITEFGVIGEWDIQEEIKGVKIEPSDTQKYTAIARGYPDWIKEQPGCLGVYVFHYANGRNFIDAWFATHFNNKRRPAYWAIREAYTGQKSENYLPEIKKFNLPQEPQESGTWIPTELALADTENDSLSIRFLYNQRSGSRKRKDQILPLQHRGSLTDGFEIFLPKEDGPIKVYVTVEDAANNLAMAASVMEVQDADARQRKYLVPKVVLPFYVYKDHGKLPYAPSGYMGNYKSIEVDVNHPGAYAGSSAIQIRYTTEGNWYGVGFVDPANDWGDILGGYDLSGAKTFSFWAKASKNVKATIGFGLIDADKPYPDTAKKTIEVELTPKWKQYSFKTKRLDLSCIRSGLVIFSSGWAGPHEIYLDEIVFE